MHASVVEARTAHACKGPVTGWSSIPDVDQLEIVHLHLHHFARRLPLVITVRHSLPQQTKVRLMRCQSQEDQVCIQTVHAVPSVRARLCTLHFLQQ
jgi:hypothetical protein